MDNCLYCAFYMPKYGLCMKNYSGKSVGYSDACDAFVDKDSCSTIPDCCKDCSNCALSQHEYNPCCFKSNMRGDPIKQTLTECPYRGTYNSDYDDIDDEDNEDSESYDLVSLKKVTLSSKAAVQNSSLSDAKTYVVERLFSILGRIALLAIVILSALFPTEKYLFQLNTIVPLNDWLMPAVYTLVVIIYLFVQSKGLTKDQIDINNNEVSSDSVTWTTYLFGVVCIIAQFVINFRTFENPDYLWMRGYIINPRNREGGLTHIIIFGLVNFGVIALGLSASAIKRKKTLLKRNVKRKKR